MPVQSALSQFGVGKQTVKGTAAANPIAYHGLTDGTVISVDITNELEERTSGFRVAPAINRTAAMPAVSFSSRLHPRAVGHYLLGALGSVSTSGTTTFTHTITSGPDLPYYTTFGTLGGTNYSVRDLKFDTLDINFEANQPATLSATGMGVSIAFPGTITPTTDDTYSAYFTPVGGTFSVDVDGASGTAAIAKITSGSISIANNLETVFVSGAITPDDVFVGRQEVEVSFDVVPDDLLLWRTIVTGTSSGSAVSAAPLYGTYSVQFASGADTLTITSPRVAFTCDFPDVDPNGGALTLSLAGLAVMPAAGGTPITATLVNTQATY